MKLIKRVLPVLILWLLAGGRAACHSPDGEQQCVSASQCPPEKEEANEARRRLRMPADHRDRLETIQGSQWTRHRATYITLLVDKEARGWRDIGYGVINWRVWKKTLVGCPGSTKKERQGKFWGISKQRHDKEQQWWYRAQGRGWHRFLQSKECPPSWLSIGEPVPTQVSELGQGTQWPLVPVKSASSPWGPGWAQPISPIRLKYLFPYFLCLSQPGLAPVPPQSYAFLTGWIEHLFTHLQTLKSFTFII